ncbi:MAG TPA: hypothetical protein VH207_06135 [Chthoniobacterales bacterium]|jgi:hypothetical protein|nr:hypothetical protein [Chthoniobacterales bacterium]
MRTLLKCLFVFCLWASLASAIVPLQTRFPQPPQDASCCENMIMGQQPNDCSGHQPKTSDEERCCANCIVALAGILNPPPAVIPPEAVRANLSLSDQNAILLGLPPPVPPPRSPLA